MSYVQGRGDDGTTTRVRITPETTPAANPAFDVTPARLVTGLITERGVRGLARRAANAVPGAAQRGVTPRRISLSGSSNPPSSPDAGALRYGTFLCGGPSS